MLPAQSFEVPRLVHICNEAWTPENGFLTPTYKLKREVLKRTFQPQIDALYARMAAEAGAKGALAKGKSLDILSSAS